MKKTAYEKPAMTTVQLQHMTQLLSGSPYDTTPPNEIHDYDDWFGSRRTKDVWDGDCEDEWDEEND